MARRLNGNTESVDNYLKAILALSGAEVGASSAGGGRVASKALADRLGVAPASVTNMLQKLAGSTDSPVIYERHRGVQLSDSGRRRALEVVRHHRLLETFLYEVLDYPLDEVHDEAERLEHFISERFEERIAAKLGHPRNDPHGHAIPTMEGEVAAPAPMLLTEARLETRYQISSVADRDAAALKALELRGLRPGVRLRVLRGNCLAEGLLVRVEGAEDSVEISPAAAGDVRIVPLAEMTA